MEQLAETADQNSILLSVLRETLRLDESDSLDQLRLSRISPIDGGLSGSRLWNVEVQWQRSGKWCFNRYVVKRMRYYEGWLAMMTEDKACREVQIWQTGLLRMLPDYFLIPIVGFVRNADQVYLVMTDESGALMAWNTPVKSKKAYVTWIEGLARLHAALWNDVRLLDPQYALMPVASFLTMLTPQAYAHVPDKLLPPLIVKERDAYAAFWARMSASQAQSLQALCQDPSPIERRLVGTPFSLLHGDYRASNLGIALDEGKERIVLIDWGLAGVGPGCFDFTWLMRWRALDGPLEWTVRLYRETLEQLLGSDFDPAVWEMQFELGILRNFMVQGASWVSQEMMASTQEQHLRSVSFAWYRDRVERIVDRWL